MFTAQGEMKQSDNRRDSPQVGRPLDDFGVMVINGLAQEGGEIEDDLKSEWKRMSHSLSSWSDSRVPYSFEEVFYEENGR